MTAEGIDDENEYSSTIIPKTKLMKRESTKGIILKKDSTLRKSQTLKKKSKKESTLKTPR